MPYVILSTTRNLPLRVAQGGWGDALRHSGGSRRFSGRNAHPEARGSEPGFEGLGKDLRIWFVCFGVPALIAWHCIPRSLRSRPLALREGGVQSKPPSIPP